MNHATHTLLEQHFETAFAAPEGIKKLRELILTLAMQGKLVPQYLSDPPASELLKDIEAEKKRLVKEGKIKMLKPLLPVTEEEKPYALPKGWEWVRLGEIGQTQTGTTPKSGDGSSYGKDVPFIKPADITSDYVNYCNEGSSLMVCIGTIGKTNLINRDCSFNQQINSVTPYKPVFPDYVQQFIRSSFFQAECWKKSSSTTIAILNKGKWESIPIAIPPLDEQHRIVARINQLMARCDVLEALRKEWEEKRRAVHSAAIQQLLTAPSSKAWDFIEEHFGELYAVKENVAELRNAILQLAVMGHLGLQDQNIKLRERTLKELTTKIGSGSTPAGGKDAYKVSGIPLIRSMNVHFGGFKFDGLAFIDEAQAQKLKNVIVFPGDVLLNITGASIGRVTVAPEDMEGARVNQHVCIIRPTEELDSRYLEAFLASPLIQNWVFDNQVGATREALTKAMIEQISVSLPPLPEQHRIVDRIDQLMALCETLDQQIDAATGKQAELLCAVMAQV
jgi:type I restriction enzyme S subunit